MGANFSPPEMKRESRQSMCRFIPRLHARLIPSRERTSRYIGSPRGSWYKLTDDPCHPRFSGICVRVANAGVAGGKLERRTTWETERRRQRVKETLKLKLGTVKCSLGDKLPVTTFPWKRRDDGAFCVNIFSRIEIRDGVASRRGNLDGLRLWKRRIKVLRRSSRTQGCKWTRGEAEVLILLQS